MNEDFDMAPPRKAQPDLVWCDCYRALVQLSIKNNGGHCQECERDAKQMAWFAGLDVGD